jgi:hypothetical protein
VVLVVGDGVKEEERGIGSLATTLLQWSCVRVFVSTVSGCAAGKKRSPLFESAKTPAPFAAGHPREPIHGVPAKLGGTVPFAPTKSPVLAFPLVQVDLFPG